jgi:hypothetical protein
MSNYLKFISYQVFSDKYKLYTPAIVCQNCGQSCGGDEPKKIVENCNLCEEETMDTDQGVKLVNRESGSLRSDCCGGYPASELINDIDEYVAICSECQDWADFYYEEEE